MWTLIKTATSAGLGFLGPFGALLRPPLIYVLILAASHTAVWVKATWVANEKCQAATLKAKIAKLELELKTQKDADAAEDKLRTELDSENEQLKKVIDAYVEELKTRPDKCLLGPDADSLQ